MKVVIVGCGRTGAELAASMSREGHEVTIIDARVEAFARLPRDFRGNEVLGNGIDEDTLKRAGIESADAFAAMTEGDNRNIMSAQMAQHVFRVERVVAKVNDPIRDQFYQQLGLHTYCRTTLGARFVHDALVDDSHHGHPLGREHHAAD